MESINDKNYELWLVRYADGELTAAEREAVEQWLEGHPEAAEELALYTDAPRLECDESVQYNATVPGRVQSLWPAVLRWSAAAAVVALLTVPAIRLLTPQEAPVQVASLPPTLPPVVAEPDSAAVKPAAAPVTKPAVRRPADKPVETPSDAEPVEEFIPSRPMTVESVLLAEEMPVEAPALDESEPVTENSVLDSVVAPVMMPAAEELIYVDNLFVVDSGNVIEQRLLAVNENIKERLQSTYLGRRLARRMPTGDELLDYTSDLRERTPQGVRMMADMVIAYNDSNR